MRDVVWAVDGCRVCGRDDWLDVISFGSVPLANGFLDPADRDREEPTFPLDVVACRGCWLMGLRHVVDPEVLFSHYVYVSSDSDLMRRHMRHIVELCVDRAGLAAGDLVVELGSNVGTQLGMFADAGMRVTGVDPARNLVEVANERGIDSIPDFFGPEVAGAIARENGPARLVLGRQCFAHIPDVHNILKGVDAVLAPDGVLAIEVPYLVDLFDRNEFDTIYHEHASYYSVGTLNHLFAAHGLRVVDVERVAVHGGSIVVFAARDAAPRNPAARDTAARDTAARDTAARDAAPRLPRPVVAELLAMEERCGLTSERAYLEFAERTRRVITAVGDLVRRLVADGRRVAGYGAPSKGTTLLQFCGLSHRELEFCSDTTTLKHGKLLPGTRIPVYSPEQARRNPPDYYVLLAWNYAEEIIRKERPYLEQGGRFIVPLPEPHIVSAESAGEYI